MHATLPTLQSKAFGVTWLSDEPLLPFTPCTLPLPDNPIVVRTVSTPPRNRDLLASRTNVHFARGGFRYDAGPQATLEVFVPNRIHVHPGTGYRGTPPAALFSTVTALLLANRGLLPMHGSAVVEDGEATLICGKAGMGKSTLTARLIARGAHLLSDDLSVLHCNLAGGPPNLFAGRRALRLHADTAVALTRAVACQASPHPAEGKIAVYPPLADPSRAFPLRRVILLGQPRTIPAASAATLLCQHFFRPGCLHMLDNHQRRIGLLAVATHFVEIAGAPAL